jgi:hypothetical protein
MVGSDFALVAGAGEAPPRAGDGASFCAHTLAGNSNAITPTHIRRMNFPRRRVHAGIPGPGFAA